MHVDNHNTHTRSVQATTHKCKHLHASTRYLRFNPKKFIIFLQKVCKYSCAIIFRKVIERHTQVFAGSWKRRIRSDTDTDTNCNTPCALHLSVHSLFVNLPVLLENSLFHVTNRPTNQGKHLALSGS